MGEVVCTVHYQEANQRDLVLPDTIPLQQLIRTLSTALGLPIDSNRLYDLLLEKEPGNLQRLPETRTLQQLGVLNGSLLHLVAEQLPPGQCFFLEASNGTRFRVRETNLIGRLTMENPVDIDLGLLDQGKVVSRQHAKLSREDNHLHLWDLNSHNGTFLNQRKLPPAAPQALQVGDEICFGSLGKGVRLKLQRE